MRNPRADGSAYLPDHLDDATHQAEYFRAERSGRKRPGRWLAAGLTSLGLVLFGVLPGSAETVDDSTSSTSESTTSTTASTTTESSETTATTAPTSTESTAAPSSTSSTAASSGGTAVDDKAKVEAAESSKAREVDAANARLDELSDALSDLEDDLEAQAAEVDIANRRLMEAQEAAAANQEQVAELEAQVVELEANLGDQAVESFKGDSVNMVLLIGDGDNADQTIRMQTMLAKATQSDIDYANQLASAREDLLARRRDAEAAIVAEEQSKADGEAELRELEESRLAYGQLASAAENRLDHLLGERAALAQLGADVDAGLDLDIDQELVDRLAAAPAPAPSSSSTPAPVTVSDGQIRSAGSGIMVHEAIVADVRQLLADAAADGVVLAGGGYRDPAGQIAVRRNNCGTSNYAIYEMPSSQCSPPTARPGRSMHEQGRAIDFTYNGRIIGSRSGPAWEWLKANANKYGLYNLPSEPWHWSTNGR